MGTATNSPHHGPGNKELHRKRIGWLYPVFRDVYFCHGLLARISHRMARGYGRESLHVCQARPGS